MSNKTYTLHPL